jgi:hypothetical protein
MQVVSQWLVVMAFLTLPSSSNNLHDYLEIDFRLMMLTEIRQFTVFNWIWTLFQAVLSDSGCCDS